MRWRRGSKCRWARTTRSSRSGHAIAGRGHCLVILDNFEQVARHAEETLGRWLDRAPEARFLVTTREVLGIAGEEALALAPLPWAEAESAVRAARQRRTPGFPARRRRPRRHRAAGAPARRPAAGDRAGRGAGARDVAARAAGAHERALQAAGEQRRAARPPVHAARRLRLVLGPAVAGRAARRWRSCRCSRAASRWRRPRRCSTCRPATMRPGASTCCIRWSTSPSCARAAATASTCWSACRSMPPSTCAPRAATPAAARRRCWRAQAPARRLVRRVGRRRAAQGGDCADLDNLVVACRRAVARGDAVTAVGALEGAWAALSLQGPFETGVALAQLVAGLPGLPDAAAARVQVVLAQACTQAGHLGQARQHAEHALALSAEVGDRRSQAQAGIQLARLLARDGRDDASRTLLVEALAQVQALGDRALECAARNSLGNLEADYRSAGRRPRAVPGGAGSRRRHGAPVPARQRARKSRHPAYLARAAGRGPWPPGGSAAGRARPGRPACTRAIP